MTMDEATFFAWIDGELSAEEAGRVAAIVAADPALAAKAEAHRAMQRKLAAAFAPIAEQPADLPGAAILSFEARKANKPTFSSPLRWSAMAATLVAGIVIGTLASKGDDTSVASRQGMLVASADLQEALDVRLASSPSTSGPSIGLTFRDKDGAICRSFTDGAAQGLACREGENWRLRALVQSQTQAVGDYRMASGADPAIATIIDTLIDGEPFDADKEKSAKQNGWR